MTKIKVLDLFSGIGGFSLGLELTGGFETVAFCENNRDRWPILKKHWPNVPIIENVKKVPHALTVDLPERSDLYPSKLCRSSNGISKRLDAIGNAVVPQIPELIGNALIASR